jgi:hypothetical protein
VRALTVAPLALALLVAAGAHAPAQAPARQGAPRPAPTRPAAPPPGVQFGVTFSADTVTVGDPFVVRVRVRAPRGSALEFPAAPDTGAPVEALDPLVVRTAADTTAVDQTAEYRLVAWDVGDLPLGVGDVVVRSGGQSRPVALGNLRVHVRSVLPADSAQRVPKPARDLIDQLRPWWLRWLWAILLALALLALLAWWYFRRRRQQVDAAPALDPYEVAEREFARVHALGLLEAGERGRFVALMVEVLRDYLAREVPGAIPSLTSTELLAALRGTPAVPWERLGPVLAEADLIKFARRPVTADRARALGAEAQAIARDIHANVLAAAAPPAAAPAEAAA